MYISRIHALFVAGLLALAFSHPASAVRVKGEATKAVATKSAVAKEWRSSNFPATGIAKLDLNELAPDRIAKLHNRNASENKIKAQQIGIGRNVTRETLNPISSLKWQVLSNGAKVSRIQVTSPDAFGLRVGIRTVGLVPGSELRFSGSDAPSQVIAAITGEETRRLVDAKNSYWTPSTDGETQIIEVYLPKGALAANVRVNVTGVSHLLTNAKDNFVVNGAAQQTCMLNVICRAAALGANFVNAENSVALIIFTELDPNTDETITYRCTGTLLIDTVAATQVPYFYTADHCISTQTLANTLNFYWNYETTTCGDASTSATLPSPQMGGATYLYSENGTTGTDASLLRINSAPPVGTFFSGWDTALLANSSTIYGIHHPEGFPKKVSQGIKELQDTLLHQVGWTSGSTLPGSNGSGLFTIGGDGAWYLRGGLYGGTAECANSGNASNAGNDDVYSRFDVVYPSLQQWLNPAIGPSVSHTGPWYNPAESGWGLTWYEYPSNGFFGLFFIYNGTGAPDWYEFAGAWTGSDVHSGNLRKNTGPAFGTTFDPGQVNKVAVGTYTLTFTSATTATLTFTVGGVTRTNVPLNKL